VVLETQLDIEVETHTSFEEKQWEEEALAMCSTPTPATIKKGYPKTYYGAGVYGWTPQDEADFQNYQFKKGNMK
jgi:hypothetical protein